MLQRLGLQTKSEVETLLEKENCTLEEVLDKSDVLQEAKAHNSKLVAFLVKGENMTKLIEYLTVDIRLDFSSFSRDFTLAERMKMGSSIPLLGSVPPPSSSTRSSSSPQKDYISLRDSIEFYAEKMNAKMLEMQKQIEMAESSQKKNESDDDSNEENDKEWESDQKTNESDETEPITTANESSLATEGNGSEDNQTTQESKEEEEAEAETTTTTTVGKNNNNDNDSNSQSEQQESSISSPQVYFDEERLEKRIRKYPQLAADILACDIDQLYTAIVSDKVLLSALFGFLSNEYPLNPLLAGYWLKVLRGLYQKKIFDLMKYTVSQDESFAQSFVTHLNIPGMDDMLLRFTMCDILLARKDISSNDVSNWWLNTGNLIDKLIACFNPENEPEIHTSAAKVLTEIVKRSTSIHLEKERINPLAASLLYDENVMIKLMDSILNNPNSHVLMETIPLFTTLIDTSFDIMSIDNTGTNNRRSSNNYDDDDEEVNEAEEENEDDEISKLPVPLRVIMSRIYQFVDILRNPPTMSEIHLSFGTLDPPLGEIRLKVIEFLSALYHISFPPIERELIRHNVLAVMFDLFFKYEFNNILHNMVLKNVSFILAGESTDLKRTLFRDVKIIERIVEANKKNEKSKVRKGYMGHLVIISNSIVTTAQSQSIVADLIRELSLTEWDEFVHNSLAERNALESKQIGSMSESEKFHDDLQEQMDKEFQDFDDMIDYDDESSSDSSDEDEDDDETMIKVAEYHSGSDDIIE